MTPHQAYEKVRAACRKANPDKNWRGFKYGKLPVVRAGVTLADVLLAIDAKIAPRFGTVATNGWLHADSGRTHWNLKNDSLEWHLENQPETVIWLAELLGNE